MLHFHDSSAYLKTSCAESWTLNCKILILAWWFPWIASGRHHHMHERNLEKSKPRLETATFSWFQNVKHTKTMPKWIGPRAGFPWAPLRFSNFNASSKTLPDTLFLFACNTLPHNGVIIFHRAWAALTSTCVCCLAGHYRIPILHDSNKC